MHISANKPVKNHHTKMGHPIVLIGTVILTIASIAGSVAFADFVPLEEMKDLNQLVRSALNQDNRQVSEESSAQGTSEQRMSNENKTAPSTDFKNIGFKSLVNPKLSSCFNCGEIIAIESMPNTAYELSNTNNLMMNQFGDYLDAHRDITRMVSPDERERVVATHDMDTQIKNTYLIKVRMQNGTEHTLTQYSPPQQDVGDTIRVITDKTITA